MNIKQAKSKILQATILNACFLLFEFFIFILFTLNEVEGSEIERTCGEPVEGIYPEPVESIEFLKKWSRNL